VRDQECVGLKLIVRGGSFRVTSQEWVDEDSGLVMLKRESRVT
jgi:hypothetical protein